MKKSEDEVLTLKYVDLDTVDQWIDNKKKHDIPALIRMIQKHGFKDPIKYEPAINNGAGGIVEGNGRDQALKTMYNQNPNKPPRGITLNNKKWLVPVLFGVDAKSQAAAESYGYDHNNATMLGGGFDMENIMQMWNDGAVMDLKRLAGAGELPISINAEDLDTALDAERERLSENEEQIRPKSMLRILISVPVQIAMDVQKFIDQISKIPGVEVDVSGN